MHRGYKTSLPFLKHNFKGYHMTTSNFIEYILNLESLVGNRSPFLAHKIQTYIYAAKTTEKKNQVGWENMLIRYWQKRTQ